MNLRQVALCMGLLGCLFVFSRPSAHGQELFGTILGTVTDTTGAVVNDAKITVTNTGTGITRSLKSDAIGEYVVPNLIPGTYSVTVSKDGYKTVTQPAIALVVDQKARIDLQLPVGAATETVTVTTTPPQLESESSEISTVIEGKEIVEAPLQIRGFGQLLSLAPGVLQANSGSGNISGYTGAQINNPDNQMGLSGNFVNGFFGDANNFELDGVSNNEFTLGTIAVNPSIDGIAEFKVQTNTYSAEFGRAGGADVQLSTKSGTNALHGDLFEFVRNNVLDAIPWDVGSNFVPHPVVPPHHENQFGGTAGGPIWRKHSFFFFDFERFTQRLPNSAQLTLPTAQQLAGDFSQPGNAVIYNPYNTTTKGGIVTPLPFGDGKVDSTNKIPAGSGPCPGNNNPKGNPCISPAAQNIAKMFQPFVSKELSVPIGQPNFNGSAPTANDRDDIDTRIDHKLTNNDQFFLRFSYLQTTENLPNFLDATLGGPPWLAFNGKTKNENAVASEVHNFSPATSNAFRMGVSHIRLSWFGFDNADTASTVGIPGINNICSACTGLPYISLGGAFGPGYGDNSFHSIGHEPFTPTFRHEAVYQWVDDVTHVAAKQTVKLGLDIQRVQVNLFQDFYSTGSFAFTSQITSNLGVGGTGDSFASFLMGLPNQVTRDHHLTSPEGRQTRFAAYVQDDYKASQKLTLNLGVRYEHYPPATDGAHNLANFDYNTGDILQGCVATSCSGGVKADKRDFAPRLGLAYMPDSGKTVVRLGFGMSYYYPGFIWDTLDGQYPYDASQLINPVNTAYYTSGDPALDRGIPAVATTFYPRPGAPPGHFVPYGAFGPSCGAALSCPEVSMNMIDPVHNKTSRVYQWTFDVQRQLTPTLLLDTAFVGNHAYDLYGKLGINIPELGVVTSTGKPLQELRPLFSQDPQLAGVTDNVFSGESWYDALQVKADKRVSHGLQFLVSYTFAKTLERGPFGSGNGAPNQTGGVEYFDPYNPMQLKFVTPYNRKHALTASYNYALPFGQNGIVGKNWNTLANTFLGGWQFSGITTWISGAPFTATGNAGSTDNGTSNLPSRICNGNLSHPTRSRWFNTACFVNPAAGSGGSWPNNVYGSEVPDGLVGPRFSDWDVALKKNFPFPLWRSESRYLQFRAEAFDVFNHVNFGDPSGSISVNGGNLQGNASGGDQVNTVVQQAGGLRARELQLGMKLYY